MANVTVYMYNSNKKGLIIMVKEKYIPKICKYCEHYITRKSNVDIGYCIVHSGVKKLSIEIACSLFKEKKSN